MFLNCNVSSSLGLPYLAENLKYYMYYRYIRVFILKLSSNYAVCPTNCMTLPKFYDFDNFSQTWLENIENVKFYAPSCIDL